MQLLQDSGEIDTINQDIKQKILRELDELFSINTHLHFITGMDIGAELLLAEMILSLKNTYRNITLECSLPYEEQASRWNETQRDRYFRVLELCDKETLLQTRYSSDCARKNERNMIEHSDIVFAVWNGRYTSITGTSIKYAKELEKRIIVVPC